MDLEKYKLAAEIMQRFMKDGELSSDRDKDLFREYLDDEIRAMVKISADVNGLMIRESTDVIYAIPREDNEDFGIGEEFLQKLVITTGLPDSAYLTLFIMMEFIRAYYYVKGQEVSSRDFMSIDEFVEILNRSIDEWSSIPDWEAVEQETECNIKSTIEKWKSMETEDNDKRRRQTKYGYVKRACNLLEEQNLLYFTEKENDIRPTEKLDFLVKSSFLNRERVDVIQGIFDKAKQVAESTQQQ